MAACDASTARRTASREPARLSFDRRVACKGTDELSCLTAPQVDAVRRVYAGASNPRTGEKIFPGLERGSELGWSPVPVGYAVDYFKHIVFKDPNWDPKTLNFDSHLAEAYPAAHQIFDANDPKLGAFVGRGGRLIMYQGGASPEFRRKRGTYLGRAVEPPSLRRGGLFMVPGMGHFGAATARSRRLVTALYCGCCRACAEQRGVRCATQGDARGRCAPGRLAIYSARGSVTTCRQLRL